MKNSQKILAKKAALVKGCSSTSSNPARDMRAALLARFGKRGKYDGVPGGYHYRWLNK